MIGSLRLDGLSTMMTVDGNVDGDVFTVFINNFLLKTLRKGDVVIMDNLSIHNVDSVEKSIKSKGANILYLSPYSPELNPIEHYWSKLKGILKGMESKSLAELEKNIVRAMDKICPKNAKSWVGNCGYAI